MKTLKYKDEKQIMTTPKMQMTWKMNTILKIKTTSPVLTINLISFL